LDNLTQFRREPEVVAETIALASKLGLDRVIARMPQGYETQIGANLGAIPADVRQRIAIVRALAQRPAIVIFDEANTALDGPSDERLRQLLLEMKGRTTIFLVSFRPTLLKLADRTLHLYDRQLHAEPPAPETTAPPETEARVAALTPQPVVGPAPEAIVGRAVA